MGIPEWDEATRTMRPIPLPDWYPAIRAARYGNVPVTAALGLDAWYPIVQAWCLTAEAAEQEAEAALIKQARSASQD